MVRSAHMSQVLKVWVAHPTEPAKGGTSAAVRWGDFVCPRCGVATHESAGYVTCPKCGGVLNGFLQELVELHPHL
jgi:rubrerythrin